MYNTPQQTLAGAVESPTTLPAPDAVVNPVNPNYRLENETPPATSTPVNSTPATMADATVAGFARVGVTICVCALAGYGLWHVYKKYRRT